MDALILAAGFGSRLRALGDSKPLACVAGVPLIELSVRMAAQAGAERVVVATGHRAAAVEDCLAALGREIDVEIASERIAHYSRPNGYSVLAGASRIPGDYLLIMADHILNAAILRGLVRCGGADRGVTLAVDRRVADPVLDPDDATWVRRDARGRIAAIGKTLEHYDAVDCGAFLATPELADAIRRAIARGRPGSVSDGMQILADEGRAATMDIGDARWIDVDDPRAHAIAEDWLRRRFREVLGDDWRPRQWRHAA
ncbi:nucleotidyl transferase [Novosphingobium sp. PC22D]|uniref:phosphocholine cytidylyltransferase family protein n=1 Tax=Novosphingobium sp. PC22D TaxID=1962403 RepID=UPI000BF211B3|nr:NTP transferase domain-containing protein [Novosphingobium sp. PC22D]PEQ13809.1 nucleotidyl transferase [Novosphingobium sp. PC22D]